MDRLRVWETTARVSVYHNNGGMANPCGTALSAVSGVASDGGGCGGVFPGA